MWQNIYNISLSAKKEGNETHGMKLFLFLQMHEKIGMI